MDNDPNNLATPPDTPTPSSFLHAPISRHNIAVVLAFTILVIAGVAVFAYLSTPEETLSLPSLSEGNPPSTSATTSAAPHVYAPEELRGAMDTTLSSGEVRVYTEEELKGTPQQPLSSGEAHVYTQEELRVTLE